MYGSRLFGCTFVACLLITHVAMASGVSFVPAAELNERASNLSLLTYQVPGGFIVADRISPADETSAGDAFDRRFTGSEFYLIQGKCHQHDAPSTRVLLASMGHIHWQQQGVMVVEIPLDQAEAFAAIAIDRVRIPLNAPPVGWDRANTRAALSKFDNKDAALIADFVSNISEPAFFQGLQEISGHATFDYGGPQSISTRYYNTADKNLIGDYLADKLTGYGYSVEFDNFTANGVPCRNIVATKLGTTTPTEYVVVGGHYDSISQAPTTNAPGAEDNGSGTASVMEIARIAAGRDFEKSIQFVLFDSEEQGLNGSYHFVNEATTEGRDLVAAITMDMIAYYNNNYKVRIEGQPAWETLMSIMENNTNLLTNIANQKDYFSFGSDHVPFQQAGIPAILAIEFDYDVYPGYHNTGDTWSVISGTAALGTQITIACAATMAEVAILQPDLSGVDVLPEFGAIELVAFPNPFNPQVTVSFSPAQDVSGEVSVYDVSGKQIAVIARGTFAQGQNVLNWNGKDSTGRAVSSGVYMFRMTAAGKTSSVQVSLVR